ncbi:MAG: hypothetical protein SF053_10530 [Bacteroidia bacterium]|nr:hypothetical protein [Bacteroidia bacterium]
MEDALMLSAIVVVAYFAWKGFIASIDPLPPPEKTKDAKCTQCGVTIPAGEDLCFHCEIIDYRKAKKEKREKAKQDK